MSYHSLIVERSANNIIHVLIILDSVCPSLPFSNTTEVKTDYDTRSHEAVTLTCIEGHRFWDGTCSRSISCTNNSDWSSYQMTCLSKFKYYI